MIKSLSMGMQEFLENFCEEIEITTNRNISDYEFTPVINRIQRKEIKEVLTTKIKEIEDGVFKKKGEFQLINKKVTQIKNKNKDILKTTGVFRDWPDDRLIYKNNGDAFTCLINEEDHLKISLNAKIPSEMTKEILNYYDFIETLEKKVVFMYDKYFGYLNSLSSNVGNGTYFKVKLRIRDDISSVSDIKKKLEENMKDIDLVILKENGKNILQLSNKNPYFGFSSILVEILGLKEFLYKVR